MYYQPLRNFHQPRQKFPVLTCICLMISMLSVGFFFVFVTPLLLSEEYELKHNSYSSITDEEISIAFAQFIDQYDRQYSVEELPSRRSAFELNYRRITEHNRNPNKSYTLEVNKFADLSDEEFEALYLSKSVKTHSKLVSQIQKNPDINLNVNWVDKKRVTEVKDQGNCGSCWSFSSTSIIETIHAIKNDAIPVAFSPQNLVDCCVTENTKGCNGGEPTDAFNYVKDEGIALEKDYPYYAENRECMKTIPRPAKITNHGNISNGNNTKMEEIIKVKTMAVGIHAGAYAFRFYKNGVIDHGCASDPITHGVTIEGAGTDNNKPYWLVRNSWGANWGLNGYVKILRSKDNEPGVCGIATTAQYVILDNI